jgi:hypothetical protein
MHEFMYLSFLNECQHDVLYIAAILIMAAGDVKGRLKPVHQRRTVMVAPVVVPPSGGFRP